MATILYGTGNTVTANGTYDLDPVGLFGVLGTGGVTVSATDGKPVDATIVPVGLLDLPVAALSTYTITADPNTNVTVAPSAVQVGTEIVLNANGGAVSVGGGLLNAASGLTVNLTNGGTFDGTAAISALSGATINFGTGGGVLNLAGSDAGIALLSGASINNFGSNPNDQIIVESNGTTATLTGVSTSTFLGDSTTLTFSNGDTLSLNGLYQDTDPTAANYISTVADSSSGGTVLVCFLPGTLIRTTSGDVVVEDIRIGDTVLAFDWQNNAQVTRRVIWAGQAHCTVCPDLPDDEAGYPVRILKDAIADGVPSKDMLITAEHCLFFDGKFVPVRMLVNNRSIFYDRSITTYDYYHIETESHSVIWADGMMTESYLDTGNRQAFTQNGNVVRLGNTVRTWENDSAAPLNVTSTFVEPLYREIEKRGVETGHPVRSECPQTSADADLHLMTETGFIIRKMREANGHAFFMIPPGVETVRIMSRTSRPSDTIGPYVDDRRQLGVLIKDIRLFEGSAARSISAHLATQAPAGWHDGEHASPDVPCRWTDGQATLHLGQRHPTLLGLLCIEILAGGPYIITDNSHAVHDLPRLTA